MLRWTRLIGLLVFGMLLLPFVAFASGSDELEHKGLVESRPADAVVGSWVIGNLTFEVDANTVIDESNGALAVDQCAEVKYTETADALLAVELKSEESCANDGDELKVEALIDARPTDTFIGTWTIGGEDFEVDDTTDIEHDSGSLEIGACAEVEYTVVEGVNIAVQLKGDDDCGGEDNEDEAQGLVETLPDGLLGMWVVDGVSYEVTADTELVEKHGPFATGACVEVEYDPATNIASKIKTSDDCFEDPDNNDQFERVYGTLEARPVELIGDWAVSGITYTVDADTAFDSDETLTVGDCVRVDYLTATLAAIQVESADNHHCGGEGGDGGHHGDDEKRYGLIDSFPADLIGDWVIDSITYTVGASTELDESNGTFVTGACVEVKYLPDTNVVLEIETEDSEHCGADGENPGSFAKATGNLDVFPATMTGTWTIDGVDYTADDTTIFKTDNGDFTVGACVEIEFQTTNNLALEIETEDPFECGDSTTPPADDAPALNINHADGAAGSNFVLTGSDFAPDSQVLVKVNGNTVATALTNSDGWVTFAVQEDGAGRSAASSISIEVNGVTSNAQSVSTSTGAPLRSLPTGYSAKVVNTNSIPLAVGLSGFSTTATNAPVMLLTLVMLTLGTAVATRQRA